MKKTLALALVAAMAISVASSTAFAASQTVKEKPAINEQTLTLKVNKSDVNDGKKGTDTIKIDKDLPSTSLYKFVGWSAEKADADTALYDQAFTDKDAKVTGTLYKKGDEVITYADLTKLSGEAKEHVGETQATASEKNIGAYKVLYPVFRRWANQEEYDEWVKNNGDAAADAEKAEALKKKLAELDEAHNATNNVNTGEKIDTKGAPGELLAYTVVDEQGTKVDSDGNTWTYFSGDHDLKVAGLKDDGSDVAFDYRAQLEEGVLLNNKNARITMELPAKYTTDNMDVTVYKVTGWCKATKVKKANIYTDGNKVYVWDNALGNDTRYVVTLAPKGASAGTDASNPGTGDFSALPVALLAVAALGATGFVAYKKRIAE